MENEYPMQFDWSNVRPQEKERLPLSGQTVKVRSHGGGSIGWRSKEYKPDPATGIIDGLPVEAISEIESYWPNGRQLKLDVIGRDSQE